MADDGGDGAAVELGHHVTFAVAGGARGREAVEAEMCGAWGEIVGAGLHDDFIRCHPAHVDNEILGGIVVWLNVWVWE